MEDMEIRAAASKDFALHLGSVYFNKRVAEEEHVEFQQTFSFSLLVIVGF